MATKINLDADIIDSRDIIDRIDELEAERAEGPLDDDDAEELAALVAIREEADGYVADWKHGETLIRDTYFRTYAEELAEDLGAVDRNARWPMTCIDWAAAAEELRQDYIEISVGDRTWYAR
jgi:hypothetical protein